MNRDYIIAKSEINERLNHAALMQSIASDEPRTSPFQWIGEQVELLGRRLQSTAGKERAESVCLTTVSVPSTK